MPSRFVPNPRLETELKHSAGMTAAKAEAARAAADQARSLAHRIMPAGRGRQITVEVEGEQVLVANHDHGGHLDEWGSIHNEAYAPLRRGIRAAGLRFAEE